MSQSGILNLNIFKHPKTKLGVYGTLFLFVAAIVLFITTKLVIVFFLPLLALPILYISNKLILQAYLLFASLAFSKDLQLGTLSLDLPDEFLMITSSGAIIIFCIINKAALLKHLKNDALFTMLILSFIYLALNIFWSINPVLSIKYLLAKVWYFIPFAMGVFMFQQVQQKFIFNIIALLTYCSAFAVSITLTYHIYLGLSFEKVNQACSLLFLNHVNYGSFIAIILPIAYYNYFYNSLYKKYKKINVMALLVLSIGLVESYCRSAWLAVIIAAIAVWLFYNKLLFKAAITSICLVTIFLLWLLSNNNYLRFKNNFSKTEFHTEFNQHWAATFNGKDVSNAERFYRWGAGMRMGAAYFPLGSGTNTFYPQYKKYSINAFKTWVSNNKEHSTVHNFYLLLFIEQGAFGLAFFIALILVLLYQFQYKGMLHIHKKMVAMLVGIIVIILMQLTSSDVLESDKVGPFFYFVFAVWWLLKNKFIAHNIIAAPIKNKNLI